MKNKKFLMAAAVLAAAISPAALQAANNTWAGTGFGYWDLSSADWTSPTVWQNGDDATFDASGGLFVTVGGLNGDNITVSNLNFTADGYTVTSQGGGNGSGLLTVNGTINVNGNTIFNSSVGGNNPLRIAGSKTITFGVDPINTANTNEAGTYITGTPFVILNNTGLSGGENNPNFVIDHLQQLDIGATLQVYGYATATTTTHAPNGQIGYGSTRPTMNLTGGTLDIPASRKDLQFPAPTGTGYIINSSTNDSATLQICRVANTTAVFNGHINDGGPYNYTVNGSGSQMAVDLGKSGSSPAKFIWGGSNSCSGFVRLSGSTSVAQGGTGSDWLIMTNGGTLGYPLLANPPGRHIIQNAGVIDLNGTSQKVGIYYSGNDLNSIITNTAVGTTSILTVGFNTTNQLPYMSGGFPRGIRCNIQDNPSTSGILGLTKAGAGWQSIGQTNGYDLSTANGLYPNGFYPTNNYHGDTTVNQGTLAVISPGAISPNSAFRLNTGGTLVLAFSETMPVKQLFLNGVEQPNGVYGSGQTSLISGAGKLQVTAATPANNVWAGGGFYQWDHVGSFWTTPAVWVDGQNAIFDATGAASSPVTVADAISAGNLNFNTAGYTINGSGGTLSISNTVTANQNAIIAVELTGANGLVKQGSGTLSIAADTYLSAGNNYTGGTYVRAGTLILSNSYANTSGTSYAVDSIEALDAGATVVIGTTTTDGGVTFSNVRGQIGGENSAAHLHMTGGTLDVNNDNKNQRIPVPDGTGLIVNNGSLQQSGLQIIPDGLDHTWSGIIADGNNGVLNGLNNTGAGKGPGYQIGIVQASGTGNWTWTGANTYSGSTRLDGGIVLKLSGAGTLGRPTLTNGMTGPMRWYTCSVDLNGTTQTISLMTAGNGSSSKVYNSAVGTTSTLVFGYGMEQAFNRNANYYFTDNLGTGGKLSLKKINTQPYMNNANNPPYLATNCLQQLSGPCDYSGDTIVDGGWLWLNSTASVSPNSAYRLATTNQALLKLAYSGDAPVRQLWINGVQQPNGTYGASTAGIDPASTGTITVTGSTLVVNPVLGVTKSGNALTFTWTGSFTLQAQTNTTSQGLGTNWVNTPYTSGQSINIDSSKGAVFFRLKQ